MTSLSREILANWQIRKSKKQKSAFIELIQSHIPEAKVEAKGSTRNIVIGDTDSAKVIYTAHYDTCAVMPLPNFITPKNFFFYIVYQFVLVALMFAVAGAIRKRSARLARAMCSTSHVAGRSNVSTATG